MGRVKEFAMWLAEIVYLRRWSEEQILSALASRYPDIRDAEMEAWLRKQIHIVEGNPQQYRPLCSK